MRVDGSHPIDAGFDEYLGIQSNYNKGAGPDFNTLYRGKQVEQKNVRCQELTKRYTGEVVGFIDLTRCLRCLRVHHIVIPRFPGESV